MNPSEVFSRFVDAICLHDIDAIFALMAPDHVFMDSLGNRIQGATSMRASWQG